MAGSSLLSNVCRLKQKAITDVQIGQFRYFKIQPQTIHLSMRLRRINPTNTLFYSQSLVLRSTVYS